LRAESSINFGAFLSIGVGKSVYCYNGAELKFEFAGGKKYNVAFASLHHLFYFGLLGVLLFAAVLTRFDMIRHHFRIAGVKEAILSERASEIYLKERNKKLKLLKVFLQQDNITLTMCRRIA